MANVDRPNGFRLVKTVSGAPMSAVVRTVTPASGADIFTGSPISITAGVASEAATNDAIAGVAVGFGKQNDQTLEDGNAYGDPANLNTPRYYDDSASTNTEWVVYYVPAEDAVFEVQTTAADTLVVGEAIDFVAGAGSTTTGLSGYELNAGVATNADCRVVEVPKYVDNDHTLANGRYWVKFNDTLFNNA